MDDRLPPPAQEVTAGAIFSVQAFKAESPELWAKVMLELGASSERMFRYIKDGRKGSAYRFGANQVVKFTTDPNETEVMALLVGQDPKYIVKVFDVFWIPRRGKLVGCIRQEMVQPGANDWKRFGEVATFYFSQILNHPFDSRGVDQFRAWAIKRFSKHAQGEVEVLADETTKVGPVRRKAADLPEVEMPDDLIYFRENQPDKPFGDWVHSGAKMPTEEMFEWFRGLCEELEHFGIAFYDLNGGNMMKRGGVHVVIDLGLSIAEKPKEVRTLEAAFLLEAAAERLERLLVQAKNLELTDELAKKVGDAVGVDWNTVDLDEFKGGMKDEMEHKDIVDPKSPKSNDTEDWIKYGKIAKVHFKEDPHYYKKLWSVVPPEND